MRERKPLDCDRPVVCVNPETGKLTIRMGRCAPGELQRAVAAAMEKGVEFETE